jgi:hypothetical protein
MLEIKKYIRRFAARHLRMIINCARTRNIYRRKFSFKHRGIHTPSLVIFFVDGFMIHGGMGDRMKGIVSAYAVCKAKKLPFRISFDYPFLLEKYLLPNIYDWRIREDENIVFSKRCAHIINVHNDRKSQSLLNISPSSKQKHVYGNMDILEDVNRIYGTDFTWPGLYEELFRPSAVLSGAIKEAMKNIGAGYISLHFRFQQLLGDFYDKGADILPDKEREELIEKCRNYVARVCDSSDVDVVVFSDSNLFIGSLEGIKGVKTLPGEAVHVDFVEKNGDKSDVHLKSFLDFYILRSSSRVFTIVAGKKMRISGFPAYAAMSSGVEYEVVFV